LIAGVPKPKPAEPGEVIDIAKHQPSR
jgi:hypothetical protein